MAWANFRVNDHILQVSRIQDVGHGQRRSDCWLFVETHL